MIREKIRGSQLVNRLENHVLPDPKTKKTVDMSSTQVNAAIALLKKVVPDMKATETTGELKHLFPERVGVVGYMGEDDGPDPEDSA